MLGDWAGYRERTDRAERGIDGEEGKWTDDYILRLYLTTGREGINLIDTIMKARLTASFMEDLIT